MNVDERRHLDRLLARASFGPRPGEREAARALGVEGWIASQLRGPAADASPRTDLARRLARFESTGRSAEALLDGVAMSDTARRPDETARRAIAQRSREVAREAAGARLVRAVHGESGLHEVMVDFWANHFTVSARKPPVGVLLPAHQDVLDRHALGRFPDLLLEVTRSPAMLVYLDNWSSSAPSMRRRDERNRRSTGINENHARELLELHTVGVDAGYGQDDVVATARVLTGWTLESRRRPRFRFAPRRHDDGPKTVLGERVRGSGQEEGRALLRRLALHPATARRLAMRLVARFVADAPPPALVARAARCHLDTEGDIAAVVRVILTSRELANAAPRKLRTPLRWWVSALRESGGQTDGDRRALGQLATLGELPFLARSPAGYPDVAHAWVDPGALLARMQVAFQIGAGRARATRFGPHVPSVRRFSGLASGEAVAVAVASPEFQWS